MKKLLILGGIMVAAAAGVVGYRWARRPTVEVMAVKHDTAIAAVYGTVKVQPSLRMNVRASNTGTLTFATTNGTEVVAVGAHVLKGQVLAQIRNSDLERELVKVTADFKAAEERLRLGPPSEPALKNSEALLGRLEKLAQLQNVPASEVDRARNELLGLRERVRAEQVELDRVVTQTREQLGALRDRKDRCEIKAPMDGILTGVNVLNGDFVNEGSTPFVVSSATFYLEGQVNEEDVGQLKSKMTAVVRLYSYAQQEFTATVSEIIPGGDNQRYTVTLNLETPPANLMSGMTGEMNIILGRHDNVLVIPTRALVGGRVFIVQDGRIKARPVKIGLTGMDKSEVVEGLRAGDHVVVADQDLLHPGQWVGTTLLKP